jgi:hypothetical protein
MNTRSIVPEKFVQARHRAVRLTPLLSVGICGLALTLGALWLAHPSFQPVVHWWLLRLVWLAGLAATLLAGAATWRFHRRSLLLTAAETDARFATHNRLEAATALRASQDPLARAQRAETEEFLQQTPLPLRRGRLAALGGLLTLLAAAHLATLLCWDRPTQPSPTAQAKPKVASPALAEKLPVAPAAPRAPKASIEWLAPEAETSATAIEEVPLTAQADSETGLTNAVLEIEVNGTLRRSQSLPDDLAPAGRHTLKPSIYLDELNVKTYDVVSYHLSARRLAANQLPRTSSPVQFIQVQPAREDTFVCPGGDQPSKCFNYVTAVKAAQLRLMKDNFTLAHAEMGKADEEWRDQNTRVGGEQNQLAVRTDELTTLLATNHYPAVILKLVRDAEPLMSEAGTKIEQQENQAALPPQGQALGYLTEVEKYLKASIKLAGKNTQPKAADPFQRRKNLELKTHPLTRAGRLDALANEQARLAGDLAGGNTNASHQPAAEGVSEDAQPINGTPGERQSEIKRRIGEFLDEPALIPEALSHLQSSDHFAGQSLEEIEQTDLAAASEPAAAAARELHQTAEALRAGGNDTAKNELADALLKLAAAAGNVRRAAQAPTDAQGADEIKKTTEAVQEAAAQLAAEARRQEENGATNAAARLNEMAKLLQGESLRQMLAQAQQTPREAATAEALAKKLDELADHAARERNPGPLAPQEVARLLEHLQRTQANLQRLASQCQNPGGSQPAKTGQSPTPGHGNQPPTSPTPATPSAEGSATRGTELSRTERQRTEAAQLLDDLRLSSADLQRVSVDPVSLASLEATLRQAARQPVIDPPDIVPLAAALNAPLADLIHSVQTDLAGLRRPFELAAKACAPVPLAYRAAVADYFEQLSRDYRPASATTRNPNDAH